MNHIHSEKDRNSETGLFHSNALHLPDLVSTLEVEKSSYLAFADSLRNIAALCLSGNDISCNRKIQLTDLLLDSHLRHKVIDESVHLAFVA